jgi:DNA-binding CsgD family transcriptional regulator
MPNPADISAKLAKLTVRQCQILYWVCSGKDYKWIAKKIDFGKDTVTADMADVYDFLELHHLERNERRAELYLNVCPIHLQEVGSDGGGCSRGDHLLAIGPAEPDPEMLALVIRDEQEGIIPVKGNLPRPPRGGPVVPYGGDRLPMVQRRSLGRDVFNWVVVLLAAVGLMAIGGVVGYFLLGGKLPTTAPSTSQTVIVVTSPPVVVTQAPIVVTSPPIIVVQPTQTSAPATQTPTIAPSPTRVIVIASPPPLGSAIIGALNADGTAAGSNTSQIDLYPKTLVDAAGQIHGDMKKRVTAFPADQTGIAQFADLSPGIWIVCFGAYGSYVNVGELTIQPYISVRQNLKWPASWLVGSTCKL